jgi:hypothetical protein
MLKRALTGMVAGAVATWTMGKVTSYLYEREPKRARDIENRLRKGGTSYGAAARKVAHAAGVSLTKKERERYGQTVHWAIGLGTAAAYGVFRRQMPGRFTRGILFGVGLWLLTDEFLVYVAGLTPGPTRFPWQTHARGLAGHIVYGLVTDGALAVL